MSRGYASLLTCALLLAWPVNAHAVNPGFQSAWSKLEALFIEANADNDKSLTKYEVKNAVSENSAMKSLSDAFSRADKKERGYVTLDQMKSWLQSTFE